MGNLYSILSDCQIGKIPIYINDILYSKEKPNNESSAVLQKKNLSYCFIIPNQQTSDDTNSLNNHQFFLKDTKKTDQFTQNISKKERNDQILTELVNLSTNGIDSLELKSNCSIDNKIPEGQIYVPPQSPNDHIFRELWDENKYKIVKKVDNET